MIVSQRVALDRLNVIIDERDQVTAKTLETVVALTADFQRYICLSNCRRITPEAFGNLRSCIHLRECKTRRFIFDNRANF